jgi:AcrR family transcriptional regulator
MNIHSLLIDELAMADRESRKKLITEQREGQIIKAAMEVFTRKGYAAATIPEIAELAGVAVGTIYNYYPGKRELFIAVIKNLIITVPLLDLIEKIPGSDITVVFKKIMQNRLNLVETGPVARIPSLMGEIQRDPELKVIWLEQFLQPFFTRTEGIYRDMVASGKFRRMEPALATRAIGGLILGFLMLKLMEGEVSPLNRLPKDEVTGALIDFILHGLSTGMKERK